MSNNVAWEQAYQLVTQLGNADEVVVRAIMAVASYAPRSGQEAISTS